MKRYFPFLPFLLVASCGQPVTNNVTAIAFSKNYFEAAIGEEFSMKAIVAGEGIIAYLSSDEDIVRIGSDGMASAISAGDATVFAVANGLSARAEVHVVAPEEYAEVKVVVGDVTMEAHCPALAFDSEKSFAVTFASETGSSARAYLETPLPQGDFVESILALRHSPLIENNPDYKLPQSYEGLCSLIEKAQGQIVCKSLYSEKQWTSYVYDDGKYLGNVLFELPEEAESALDIIALAKTVSLKDLSSQTLLELLAAVLDQGDLDTTAAAAKLMKAFLYHTDFFGSKDETGMQFRAEVHDDFSADLLDYLSKYNLGEVSFLSAGLEANFERKADEYRLKDLTFSASANLFGELNKVEADFVSTKHETKDSLYLDEIQRQLEADAHQ